MAKATRIEPKPVKQPPVKILLELSEGEADFILGITSRIGGSMTDSPRKYNDRIQEALTGALGVRWDDTDSYPLLRGAGLRFENYGS